MGVSVENVGEWFSRSSISGERAVARIRQSGPGPRPTRIEARSTPLITPSAMISARQGTFPGTITTSAGFETVPPMVADRVAHGSAARS